MLSKLDALTIFAVGVFLTDYAFLELFEKLQLNPDLSMVLSPVIVFLIWIAIYYGVLAPRIKPKRPEPTLV